MNKLLVGVCVFALMSAAYAADEGQCLKDGDNVVLIGDSITEQGFRRPWGYYHVLTNVAGKVAKAGGPKVNFIPLGYSGYQVKGWSEKERDVKAVLSHQGFSETLDLTVALDGKEVWKDKLDRNGRNRIEKTLHLKQGWNALEITCVHHNWQRQFSFDFEPLDGDNLDELKYDLK